MRTKHVLKPFGLGAALGLLALFMVAGDQGQVSWGQGSLPLVRTLGFGSVSSVVFSPDGRYLAAGGAASAVHLINTSTWQVVRTCEGHTDWVSSVVFSPDGGLLASGSGDSTIKIWEVATGRM